MVEINIIIFIKIFSTEKIINFFFGRNSYYKNNNILINIIFGDISSLNIPLFLFIVGFKEFPIGLFFRHFFVLFIFYYIFLHNYFLFFINI